MRRLAATILLLAVTLAVPGLGTRAPAAAQEEPVYRCTVDLVQLRTCRHWRGCGTNFNYDRSTLLPTYETVTGDRQAGDDRWLAVEDPVQGVRGYLHITELEECEIQPWQTLPIRPVVSDAARAIYQRGQAQGNDPHAFSKVGDCQNSEAFFLSHFDTPRQYDLGPYADLQPAIDQFAGSFGRVSAAVKGGYTVASALSPLASDPAWCESSETPLMCEDRLHNPSLVLISMETWDRSGKQPLSDYEKYLDLVVQYWIEQGVVPILATKADNIEGGHQINAMIARVAQKYEVPLWNWWLAAQSLDHHGFSWHPNDNFHLSWAGSVYSEPDRLRLGWPVRNLTALQAIDAVWRGLTEPQD